MPSGNDAPELPRKTSRTRQDGKFHRSSAPSPSFRVYYAVAPASVPFCWESCPGTPKNAIPTATLPPLTPPPSYQYRKSGNSSAIAAKRLPSSGILASILPKRFSLCSKPLVPASPSVSSSSSTSTDPSLASYLNSHYEDEFVVRSRKSILCFRGWY